MPTRRILLIQPPLPQTLLAGISNEETRKRFIPLGLGYLASALENAGYEPEILDMQNMGLTIERLHVQDGAYLAVGITCVTNTYNNALRIAEIVKGKSPETKVVLGGPHVSFVAEDVFRESNNVDVVVRGEGEYTLVELVTAFLKKEALDGIKGITFRRGNEVVSNPDRLVELELDKLPVPARHLFNDDLYSFSAIVASRGCLGRCIFCVAAAMSQHRFRTRSPENIIKEIETLQGSKKIIFYDNTFLGNSREALVFLQMLKNAKLNISWSAELRADEANEQMFELLRECGCTGVQFGVESGSDSVLKKIGKGLTKEKIKRSVKLARQAGLEVVTSFSFGHPFDTKETLHETILMMQELRSYGVHCIASIVTPFPGTSIYEHSDKYKIKIHHKKWEEYTLYNPVMSTDNLSSEEIGSLFMLTMLESLPSLQKSK